jgi:hypothetical protein
MEVHWVVDSRCNKHIINVEKISPSGEHTGRFGTSRSSWRYGLGRASGGASGPYSGVGGRGAAHLGAGGPYFVGGGRGAAHLGAGGPYFGGAGGSYVGGAGGSYGGSCCSGAMHFGGASGQNGGGCQGCTSEGLGARMV